MSPIGFSLQETYPVSWAEVLTLLKKVGFGGISPAWQDATHLEQIAQIANGLGLCIHSLHAPHKGVSDLWSEDRALSAPPMTQMLACLDACAHWHIPVLVIHPWGKFDYTFQPENLFFGNFDRLVEYAQNSGVQIAFENLQGPEYLMALLDRYVKNPTVGFCWDSGHELCYPPPVDLLKMYGDRLIFTHLNDNYGQTQPNLWSGDDLHLLPGDGNAHWDEILKRLKGASPQSILNFELKVNPKPGKCKVNLYSHLPLETFLQEAFQQAKAFANQYF